jgi:hypothetical protein
MMVANLRKYKYDFLSWGKWLPARRFWRARARLRTKVLYLALRGICESEVDGWDRWDGFQNWAGGCE